MRTLELFNGVLGKEPAKAKLFISEEGFIIEPNALWAKDQILDYYRREKLNGNDLNKTFHKSWKKIRESSRFELFVDQIFHYLSTYGTDFQGEIYIPDEVLEIPDLKLKYKVIKAYTPNQIKDKCLGLLKSGIALKEETIDKVLSTATEEGDYIFTGDEGIRNKEATIKIADLYGVMPQDTMEFFRYIIYRSTGQSLLIKNQEVIDAIKSNKGWNPAPVFKKFGLVKLAGIFNRYKPLFLAFKGVCPKTINRISKLSKDYHEPLVSNPLNNVTNELLDLKQVHWLENATPFALFKAIAACWSRKNGQDAFLYRIRNGKSWVRQLQSQEEVCRKNYEFLMYFMRHHYSFIGKKFYFPKGVKYALPTSEKMFVGNIPTGTKFIGKKLVAGIYWKNSWGANDLDLSGLNIGGKVGWNSTYNQGEGNLMYSGDLTSAPNGAVEYLHANSGLNMPTLIMNNVYSGSPECEYKIVVGKGSKVSRQFMMDPNKVFAEAKCQSVQKQTILGMMMPHGEEKQSFVLLNFGAGNARVSGNSEISELATKALFQQWENPFSFNKMIEELGGEVVDQPEASDYDFSLSNLEKDSFTSIFKDERD